MQFELTPRQLDAVEADAAVGILCGSSIPAETRADPWNPWTGGLASELAASSELGGKHQEAVVIHRPAGLPVRRLALVSCGDGAVRPGDLREAAGAAWRKLQDKDTGTLSVLAPRSGLSPAQAVSEIAEGIAAACFRPGAYKTSTRSGSRLERVSISLAELAGGDTVDPDLQEALASASAIAQGTRVARELVNEPGNRLRPRELAARAEKLATDAGLECEVLDAARIRELGMGALLGVARGSTAPPVLMVLKYRPDAPPGRGAAHLGLIGKAVTFDTGGISLKPSKDMHLMKYDMAGGAAMLGAMLAIARLRPAVPVTAVIPSVENMPGGDAQRPGDVVTTREGTTVEVLNTDAEGRLILADAITYAKELGCSHLVDAATLTGAVVVALADRYTGMFGNDDRWTRHVQRVSEATGEPMWRMPAGGRYTELLKSPIADLANIGPRWGGACTAATFLLQFAGDTPLVHLDIAGTAWHEKEVPHAPVGPSGVGVATLARLALSDLP